MADTTTPALATIGIVVVGQWSKGEQVSPALIVGGTVYILGIAAMESASPVLAKRFAVLVLITAAFTQAMPIFKRLGLLDDEGRKSKRTPPRFPPRGRGGMGTL